MAFDVVCDVYDNGVWDVSLVSFICESVCMLIVCFAHV